jgi:hypothetical protein
LYACVRMRTCVGNKGISMYCISAHSPPLRLACFSYNYAATHPNLEPFVLCFLPSIQLSEQAQIFKLYNGKILLVAVSSTDLVRNYKKTYTAC